MVASAEIYQFNRLSANGSQNVAGQLSLIVSDLGGGNVMMRIANAGPIASVVTKVYFDDDANVLKNMTAIDNSDGGMDGVAFKNMGAETNFASKPKGWDTDFSAFARTPRPLHGVDPSESVGFTFSLTGGRSFASFVSALNDNTLRVGLHVQALPDGQSDSFIVTSVPAPAAAGLGVVGLVSMAGLRRKID